MLERCNHIRNFSKQKGSVIIVNNVAMCQAQLTWILVSLSSFLLVNTANLSQNLRREISSLQTKIPLAWIPLKMAGFYLQKITKQHTKSSLVDS